MKKVLPCVYATAGLILASRIDSLLSFIAGLTLMLIACLIWMRQFEPGQPDR